MQALGEILSCDGARVIIGKDNSHLSSQLEKVLCKGLMLCECAIWLCGVAPLPAINYVAKTQGADWVVMISTCNDEGRVCLYGKNGKILLPSEIAQLDCALCEALHQEKEIAHQFEKNQFAYTPQKSVYPSPVANVSADCLTEEELGCELVINQLKKNHRIRIVEGVQFLYSKHLRDCFSPFAAQKVKLWVSSSTMSGIAPKVFRDLGCDVSLDSENDAKKSLHECAKSLKKEEIGFVFNNDGTALCALVDKRIYNGDAILLALSTLYRLQGKLKKKLVVGTQLSSSRLQRELAYNNTALYRANDGENCLYQSLLEVGCVLGGDRSGRVLMLDKSQCADALLSALCLLEVKKTIGSLPKFAPYPTYEKTFECEQSTEDFEKEKDSIACAYNKKGRLLFLKNPRTTLQSVYFECFLQNYADTFCELEKDLLQLFEKHNARFCC